MDDLGFNDGSIFGFIRIPNQIVSQPELIAIGKEHTAVVGKNGTGKTTFLRHIISCIMPDMKIELPHFHKYWSGGFVLEPNGARDGFHELTPIDLEGPSEFGWDSHFEDDEMYWKFGETIGYGTTTKYVNPYIKSHVVVPSTLPFSTKSTRLWGLYDPPDWEPELDEKLDLEILNQNRFCVLRHPMRPKSLDFDDEWYSVNLAVRIIELNEDAMRAREIQNEIKNFMQNIVDKYPDEEEASIDENGKYKSHPSFLKSDDFLNLIKSDLLGKSLVTPFFLGWDILMDNIGNHDGYGIVKPLTMAKRFLSDFPSIMFEWPRGAFQGSTDFLIAAVSDPHISTLIFASDVERLRVSTAGIRPAKNTHLTWSMFEPGVEETDTTWNAKLETHLELTSKILNLWRVIPETIMAKSESNESELRFRIIDGNIRFADGKVPNESTKRWILRAAQIAAIQGLETPYKVAIWDEPELGLHPTAVEAIKYRIFPYLKKNKIKLIFSTHSTLLSTASSKILKAQWSTELEGYPIISELPYISDQALEDLGASRQDLLASIETLLIVEGKHDKIVLESYLGQDFISKERIRITTMQGTEKLMFLPEAEIIMDFLTSRVVILVDGGKRSGFTGKNESLLEEINSCFKMNRLKGAKIALNTLKNSSPQAEGEKLLSVIEQLLMLATKNPKLLSRFSMHLLEEDDIIHYLDPNIVLSPYSTSRSWDILKAEWRKHKKGEKNAGIRYAKLMDEKSYYKKVLGARLSLADIRKASMALQDSAPIGDFERVRELLRMVAH